MYVDTLMLIAKPNWVMCLMRSLLNAVLPGSPTLRSLKRRHPKNSVTFSRSTRHLQTFITFISSRWQGISDRILSLKYYCWCDHSCMLIFNASTGCCVFYTSPCPDECLVVWPEAAYQRGWQVHYHALPPTWTRVQGCWRVHYTCAAANLDSSAGLASPLHTWCGQLGLICRSGESLTHVMWPTWTHPQGHTYCSRGIIWPHAVLSCLVEYVFL